MLKIHKTTSKKLLLISITSICITFGLLGFYYLTYIPELSHAETVTYDPIPRYHPNISDITFMQDMTEEVCQNSYENDTKQLIDKRDNKTYWVTKLKDGNCWMTQNLAYDDSAATVSLPSSWGTDNAARKYYNPGLYVYSTPASINSCRDENGLKNCTSRGWVDVTRWVASDNPNYTSVVDTTNKIYDAHYLAGNYYSYVAATAGSASNAAGTAASSICPNGWQLPTSFGGLFGAYGSFSGLSVGTQDIRLAPLYFVYGGWVGGDSLDVAGSQGYYWLSTAGASNSAYALLFSGTIRLLYNSDRLFGFSVRCVARGEAVVRPAMPAEDNVKVTINSQISLDLAEEVAVEKSETNPSTADLKVKVSSNQPYSVNINAREHAELISENGDKIPSNGGALTAAENNWGIMKPGDTTYTKVTTTPQLFYQAMSAEAKDILFKIGISTALDLANGEYSTDITVTATQN